jgi:hypothetical protein
VGEADGERAEGDFDVGRRTELQADRAAR